MSRGEVGRTFLTMKKNVDGDLRMENAELRKTLETLTTQLEEQRRVGGELWEKSSTQSSLMRSKVRLDEG